MIVYLPFLCMCRVFFFFLGQIYYQPICGLAAVQKHLLAKQVSAKHQQLIFLITSSSALPLVVN